MKGAGRRKTDLGYEGLSGKRHQVGLELMGICL